MIIIWKWTIIINNQVSRSLGYWVAPSCGNSLGRRLLHILRIDFYMKNWLVELDLSWTTTATRIGNYNANMMVMMRILGRASRRRVCWEEAYHSWWFSCCWHFQPSQLRRIDLRKTSPKQGHHYSPTTELSLKLFEKPIKPLPSEVRLKAQVLSVLVSMFRRQDSLLLNILKAPSGDSV